MLHQSDGAILIVDDDGATRHALAKTLTKAGYRTRESDNGIDALKLLHVEQPALVLLDFEMPQMDGDEVLKQLRSDRDPLVAQIPAIMLTGHGGEESEVRCLQAGADDFVTKPINPAVLRARIETQLRLRSMRRQLEQQNAELEAWRRNLERDLEAARLTQQSLIPQKPPGISGWEIAACYRPVIQVGGDIYGWLPLKKRRMLFWIADATGHGASAALMTTLAKLLFHHGATEQAAPVDIMQAVNHDFRTTFGTRSFMTAMCVALDPSTGRAAVVGAGHPPLLISRHDGEPETVPSATLPLGLIERPTFCESIVDLAVGDAFVLYTDGLFGAPKTGETRLGPVALAKMLDASAPNAEVLLARLLARAAPNPGQTTLADDLAAVAVRRAT
jgi:sigma-B regulation protein RsbU (phosphoserine phosphatase)